MNAILEPIDFAYPLLDMDAAKYYADPCVAPSLTQSTAHTLISESCFHAWLRHPKLGGVSRSPTRDMDRGTILHDLVWGNGESPNIDILPYTSFRTKAAQDDRDASVAAGRMPILAHAMDDYRVAAVEIRKQIESFGISLEGQTEATVLWTEIADDGTEVQCRGRLDMWQGSKATILDLKTCGSCHPEKCRKSMVEYGGDIQRAAYVSAIEHQFPDLAGRIDFINLFATFEKPYMVTPIRHSGSMRMLGEAKWRRAINAWAKCLRTNNWPGYVTDIIEVSPSPWDISKENDAACETS